MDPSNHANPSSGCPDQKELLAFSLGKLPPAEIERIGDHLAICEPCRERLGGMDATANGIVGEMRLLGRPVEFDESECGRVVAKVVALGEQEAIRLRHASQKTGTSPAAVPMVPGRQTEKARSTRAFAEEPTHVSIPAALARIPGYTIVREIGRGGMGIVYEAVRKSTNQPVALKIIIPPKSADEKAVRLFLREASTLSRLRHKRIVRFHELGMSGGRMFLAMEYVDAVDIEEVVQWPIEPRQVRLVCAVVCQVLEALEYAHGLGVVHRDVKLSNVLLAREGKKLRVKLTDFGLAKNFYDAGLSELTEDGEGRGTLMYMPPEQLDNARYAKPTSDVYSTGVLLYHLLSGAYPFEPAGDEHLVTQFLTSERVPLKTRCANLPDSLIAILDRALAEKPRKRFGSAGEMREALLPFTRKSSGGSAIPSPEPEQSSLPWHRRVAGAAHNWITQTFSEKRQKEPPHDDHDDLS